jgi:hypothetical protein
VEGADPRTRAFWSLEDFRQEPLRTGTRVNAFEEAFAAMFAGLPITYRDFRHECLKWSAMIGDSAGGPKPGSPACAGLPRKWS